MRIGIDIGGTKTEVIALDEMGKCLLRRRVGTPANDYSAMLQTIVSWLFRPNMSWEAHVLLELEPQEQFHNGPATLRTLIGRY